jgi:hypothetical protein
MRAMRRRRRVLAVTAGLCTLLTLLAPFDLRAQTPPAPAGPAAAPPEAAYARGLELARRGEWEHAAALFELVAHLGFKNALWNLAECYRQLGRPASAIATLQRFLAHPRANARDRQQAEADIRALRGRAVRLSVQANLAGARVSIDGREVGRTPLTGYDLNPGQHLVEVDSPGYGRERRELRLLPGDTSSLGVTLHPLPGRLLLETRPSGAQLWLGGTLLGRAPLSRTLPAGSLSLEVRLEGHRTVRQAVVLEPGETKEVVLSLQQAAAFLNVAASPPGVQVTLGTDALGAAPITGRQLLPAQARITLSRPGFQSWSAPLELGDGDAATVEVRLARGRLHPGWFALTAAVALGTLAGGAVLLDQSATSGQSYQTLLARLSRLDVPRGQVAADRQRALELASSSDRRFAAGTALLVTGAVAAAGAVVLGIFSRWSSSRGTISVRGQDGAAVRSHGAY